MYYFFPRHLDVSVCGVDARGLKEVKCPKDIKAVLQAASIIQGFIYTGVTQYIL
jgi:hypothetical protein